MQFIPSQAWDVLILIISAVGVVLAVRRIQSDFRKGPRFPEGNATPVPSPAPNQKTTQKRKQK